MWGENFRQVTLGCSSLSVSLSPPPAQPCFCGGRIGWVTAGVDLSGTEMVVLVQPPGLLAYYQGCMEQALMTPDSAAQYPRSGLLYTPRSPTGLASDLLADV